MLAKTAARTRQKNHVATVISLVSQNPTVVKWSKLIGLAAGLAAFLTFLGKIFYFSFIYVLFINRTAEKMAVFEANQQAIQHEIVEMKVEQARSNTIQQNQALQLDRIEDAVLSKGK